MSSDPAIPDPRRFIDTNPQLFAALAAALLVFAGCEKTGSPKGGISSSQKSVFSRMTSKSPVSEEAALDGLDPESWHDIYQSAKRDTHFSADAWLKSDRLFMRYRRKGNISDYDRIIKKMARRYGFDWRLIAAQIYVESNFRNDARSHVGARGLMQIMPGTARYLGADPSALVKPETNISLGCMYDQRLHYQWKAQASGPSRLAFALASYNAGRGRVLRSYSRKDRRITWRTVHKSLPAETRQYVHKIWIKHDLYKRHFLP